MSEYQIALPGLMNLLTPNSDALPTIIPLAPHDSADGLWCGIANIGPVRRNGQPFEFAAALAELEFLDINNRNSVAWLASSADDQPGDVTISGDPADWLFSVPKQCLPLPAGLHEWRFRVTDTDGVRHNLYHGSLLVR